MNGFDDDLALQNELAERARSDRRTVAVLVPLSLLTQVGTVVGFFLFIGIPACGGGSREPDVLLKGMVWICAFVACFSTLALTCAAPFGVLSVSWRLFAFLPGTIAALAIVLLCSGA